MGILRTDIISHSQLEGSGSVEFDGDGDSLTFTATSALSLDSDFTIEFYIFNNTIALDTQHPSPVTMPAESGHNSQIYTNSSNNYYGLYKQADIVTTGNNSALTGVWQHVAFTRKGSICFAFLDGVLKNTAVSTVTFGGTSGTYRLGSYTGSGGDVNGFISNLRIIKGTAIYTANFTSPKFELKNIAGTSLLGCQSTTSATDFAITPNTITANNDAAASSFHPSLKKDITDTGVVFDGVTTFDSQAYMVPPSGKTTERNRGRAIFPGGATSPYKDIQVVDISSGGIGQDFGDTISAAHVNGSASSSTRMLVTIGGSPSVVNTIEFITIANIASSTDFGDLTEPRRRTQSLSNSTRAVHVGGTSASPASLYKNEIDYNTIATAGNATDFGDTLVAHVATGGSVASSTRGVYSVGYLSGSYVNTLEFITIATTGNGQDFGDLNGGTIGYHTRGSTCDSTRGLFSGGYNPSAQVQNKIDFITIASTGNATDFGDLFLARRSAGGTSNSIHSIFAGGYLPGTNNTIDRVLIQTTGNAKDFGDLFAKNFEMSGSSDSHGGLS